MGWPDRLGALEAVTLAAPGGGGQCGPVGATVHHDCVHPIGHGEGLQVALDGHRQGQLVDQVDRRTRHDGTAAQVLEAEH